MRGGYIQLVKQVGSGVPESRVASAIERAKAQHKEDCERRLALIANNAHPDYRNGHPKHAEKFGS